MSVKFGSPNPIHPSHPLILTSEILIGLVVMLAVTIFVDKLGTAMFHRGFAKPFYIKGRRIHHSIIYFIIPLGYGTILILFLLGYIQFIWSDFWMKMVYVTIISSLCIAVDFIGDRFWPEIRKNVILHHEWIYSVIPAYIFTYIVVVVL